MFCHMYIIVPHISAYGDQKRVLVPIDLELQVVVSHYESGGNWTCVF